MPGALRCLVEPSWLKELTKPLPKTNNDLLTAAMTGASGEAITVRESGKPSDTELPFDYLVLAIGSTYAAPINTSTPCSRTSTIA